MRKFKEIVGSIFVLLILIIIAKLYINLFQFFNADQLSLKTYSLSYLMWVPFTFVICLAPMIYWKSIYNIYDFLKAIVVVLLTNLITASFTFLF